MANRPKRVNRVEPKTTTPILLVPRLQWCAATCPTHNKKQVPNTHVLCRIQTHHPSNQAAADLRLRQHDHLDQQM